MLVFGHIAFTLIGAYATAWQTLSAFKKSFALKLAALLASYQYPVFRPRSRPRRWQHRSR